ncbi:MAG: hypothetical protein HRT52_18855 [Colwellia sp.]|nr:hypothetical protein [Colwellia sp.]
MNKIRGLKFLLVLLFISNAQAADYSVLDEQGFFYLVKAEQKLCEIHSVGGLPKFIKLEYISSNQEVVLIKYFAGTAGTHDLIDVYRACVYDTKNKRALADVPYKYQSDNHEMLQPKFKVSANLLIVIDLENEETFEIKLAFNQDI